MAERRLFFHPRFLVEHQVLQAFLIFFDLALVAAAEGANPSQSFLFQVLWVVMGVRPFLFWVASAEVAVALHCFAQMTP